MKSIKIAAKAPIEAARPQKRFSEIEVNPKLTAFIKRLGLLVIFSAALLYIIMQVIAFEPFLDISDESSYGDSDFSSGSSSCNVAGLTLHGDVVSYISPENYDSDGNLIADETAAEDLTYQIGQAEADENIKAIILEVDSYGGAPVAGEEIADALRNATKPTVALIRGAGDSAAYWAATGADRIFASKNSDVGSIGVTMSYLDAVKQNADMGLTYNQLSSGKYKDTGDPGKTLSDDEKKLLMRDVKIIYQNFVDAVAANRKLDAAKVAALADGSTMLGQMALQNGLIDEIGGEAEAKEYLKGIVGEDIEICW